MDGIVTLLPEPYYSQVETIWAELWRACGVRGVMVTPAPHFSWHVAQSYNQERLQQILTEECATEAPFAVQTAGLGIFSRERPVVYLALVKTQAMLAFHQRLVYRLQPVAQEANPYYDAANWMPHITLVFEDINQENLQCALGQLIFRSFNWTFLVDSLMFVSQPEGQASPILFRYPLGGRV